MNFLERGLINRFGKVGGFGKGTTSGRAVGGTDNAGLAPEVARLSVEALYKAGHR